MSTIDHVVPTHEHCSFGVTPTSDSTCTQKSIVVDVSTSIESTPNPDELPVPRGLFWIILSIFTKSGVSQDINSSDPRPLRETAQEERHDSGTLQRLIHTAGGWFRNCVFLGRIEHSSDKLPTFDSADYWNSGHSDPETWSEAEQELREIPHYVFDYAPLIHLYSGENYWPGDIGEHLIHTTPHLNYTPIQAQSDHPNLTDLIELNKWGRFVYLQSDDNVEDYPDWLGGQKNIPTKPGSDSEIIASGPQERLGDEPARTKDRTSQLHENVLGKKTGGGRSDAPAILVVVPKPDGIVDAFWFFFYSYNLGNTVFNIRFGNHVGDWEHTLVRFQHGEPKEIFFSEHNFGEAYAFDAVEKMGKRPVGYSATGSHAMYGTAGEHPYVLPNGVLKDVTDRGPLWDPLLNVYAYTYEFWRDTLRASTRTPKAPLEWFYFGGRWGDKIYPLSDPRQYVLLGNYHYVTGPTGPRFKNLARRNVCQSNDRCIIKHWLSSDTEVRTLPNYVWEEDQGPESLENSPFHKYEELGKHE